MRRAKRTSALAGSTDVKPRLTTYSRVDNNGPVGRPITTLHAIGTPDRVLDAAESEFAAVGFALARLADIAERAGIRRPSLLYHFPSKDLLYRAVVERVFDRLADALLGSMSSVGSFDDRIDAMIQTFVEFLDTRTSLAPIIVREIIAEPDSARPEGSHGRMILLERVAPLLGLIEDWITREGGERLRPDLPVRGTLVDITSALLMRSAAGSLRVPLWGESSRGLPLARYLFLRDPEPSS